jgi:hypothetical protein
LVSIVYVYVFAPRGNNNIQSTPTQKTIANNLDSIVVL